MLTLYTFCFSIVFLMLSINSIDFYWPAAVRCRLCRPILVNRNGFKGTASQVNVIFFRLFVCRARWEFVYVVVPWFVSSFVSSSCGWERGVSAVAGCSVTGWMFCVSSVDGPVDLSLVDLRMRFKDLRSRGLIVLPELLEPWLLSSVRLLMCCSDRRHRSVCQKAERNWREERLYSSGFSTELR